ncbi:MAG: polyhydroxyalkanoate synthesis regulator DNA-binding domain-containing protein [Terriglobales bacterium]
MSTFIAAHKEAARVKPAVTIIKKYANRRMYDTSASRYINLEDIAALVQKGKEIRVVDAKTGEDLTHVTLTQIIMEDAKAQPAGLPLELLRQIIVASNHAGREVIMWYLKSAFEAYDNVQNAVRSGLSDIQAAAVSPLHIMERMIGATPPKPPESNELGELRRRIAELEAQKKGTRRQPRKPGRRVARSR